MLKPVREKLNLDSMGIEIGKTKFPKPFPTGLEYSSPARGSWNIVHLGMLLPEAHQIYICAPGCLRGVILTAAEMKAMDRFSSVIVQEKDLYNGKMEALMIDGISDILTKLPVMPPVVIVFPACIHHFMGCDFNYVYTCLRERFPQVDFIESFMDPIMQKKGITPDQRLRRQLYSVLKPQKKRTHAINIIGNELAYAHENDIQILLVASNYEIHDVTTCKSYKEFLAMGSSAINIYNQPAASYAVKDLEKRLGQPYIYLPQSYSYEELENSLQSLVERLGLMQPSCVQAMERCEEKLAQVHGIIGNQPIVIDYTATTRPLSLARLLLDHGFQVTGIFLDSITADEKHDFFYLQQRYPKLLLFPTNQADLAVIDHSVSGNTLAIGQKAAYFTNTGHFVNIVAGGGYFGFMGIIKLLDLLVDAFANKKDTKLLVQKKGWGCISCL